MHPAVTHPVCALDLQERIHRARRDAVARSVGRPGLMARLLHRSMTRTVPHPSEARDALDVWAAFRV